MTYDWHKHYNRIGRQGGSLVGGQVISKQELLSMFLSPDWNVRMAASYIGHALDYLPQDSPDREILSEAGQLLGLLLGQASSVDSSITGARDAAGPQEEEWIADGSLQEKLFEE